MLTNLGAGLKAFKPEWTGSSNPWSRVDLGERLLACRDVQAGSKPHYVFDIYAQARLDGG